MVSAVEFVAYIYAFLLLILLVYASNAFFLVLRSFRPRTESNRKPFVGLLPSVTVQLPVYNEKNVVERLLRCVAELDYPKELLAIQLIDDSTDETSEIASIVVDELQHKGIEIAHLRRTSRDGFKAGALAEATKSARGEFVAIFDADFLPPKDFIRNMLPYFDESTSFVQARWEHMNRNENILTRAEAIFLDGHFSVEQFARNTSGLFMNFNGTAGIWRKADIDRAGGWRSDTLTEDLDLSFRSQMQGRNGKFVPYIFAPAELPAAMNSARSQQYRWTKGTTETALSMLPRLLGSPLPRAGAKVQGVFHLTANFVYPTILALALLTPIYNSVKFSIYSSVSSIMPLFGLGLLFTFAFYLRSQIILRRDIWSFVKCFPLALAISMGFSVSNTRAVASAILRKKSEFVRTPKSDSAHKTYKLAKDRATIFLEVILCIYSLVSVAMSSVEYDFFGAAFSLLFAIGFGIVAGLSIFDK